LAIALPAPIILFFYWINCACSHSCAYLTHRKDGNTIHDYMGNLFYTPGNIDFHMECYHYETYTTTSTDSKGRTKTTTHTRKVTTWTGTESFKYSSWLDVSGPFLLDTSDFVHDPKQAWIKLNLSYTIDFIDEATRQECERQKDFFIQSNKHRDTHYSFSQHDRIETFYKYNLVSLGDNPERTKIKCRYLFLSSLFCCAELYKMYVDSFCIRQKFTIKKLLSCTKDLKLEENARLYLDQTPKVIIQNMPQTYNDPSFFRKTSFVQDLPNKDDVEKINNFYKSVTEVNDKMNQSADNKNDLPGLSDLENNVNNNVNNENAYDNTEKIYGMTDSFAAQAVVVENVEVDNVEGYVNKEGNIILF